jgi:tetratricopeptide (TPR) repeat protein
VTESRADHEFAQALVVVETSDHAPMQKVEMLVEMALGLQQKPKSPGQLQQAVSLYDRALELCPANERLIGARLHAGKAGALRSIPGSGIDHLLLARAELEQAIVALREFGGASEEVADAEMSLGVVLHALASVHAAKLTDAIAAYQRATRVFDRTRYPREFAILQNNLATAYLSMPMVDERAKLREALAVQAFTDALAVVTLDDDPVEYAMLQNNLGNALQYAASGHPLHNGLRALEAYDAALKVRNARDMPVQYANTLANKANCLRNLPDDPQRPGIGNPNRLTQAAALYAEAAQIFRQHVELEKAELVELSRAEIASELEQAWPARSNSGYAARDPNSVHHSSDTEFGVPRIGDDG